MQIPQEYIGLPAISIWQPFPFLIAYLIKDVENRTWRMPERFLGKKILIHASKNPRFNRDEARALVVSAAHSCTGNPKRLFHLFENAGDLAQQCGGIVGTMVVSGVSTNHESPWASPQIPGEKPVYHWEISTAAPGPFVPVRGRQGFFVPFPKGVQNNAR